MPFKEIDPSYYHEFEAIIGSFYLRQGDLSLAYLVIPGFKNNFIVMHSHKGFQERGFLQEDFKVKQCAKKSFLE